MISLVFLVLILAYRPYCTDGLNQLQAGCLLVNVFTLFVGIMLIITAQLEEAAKRAEEEFDESERNAISVIVFIANLFTVMLPMLQEMPRSKAEKAFCFSTVLFKSLEIPRSSHEINGFDQSSVAAVDLTATRPSCCVRQSAKVELNLDEIPSRTPSGRNSRASLTHTFVLPSPSQPVAGVIDMTPAVTDHKITAAAVPPRLVSPHVDRPSTKQYKAASASEQRDPAPSGRKSRASLTPKFVPTPDRPPQADMAPAVADYEITAAAMPLSSVSSRVDRPRTKQSKAANEEWPAPSGHSSRASLTHKVVETLPPSRRHSRPEATDIETASAVANYEISAAVMRQSLVSPHVDRPRTKYSEAASMVGDICWARLQPP
jgi:hypothetical protein